MTEEDNIKEKPHAKDIAVIILSYNTKGLLAKCIQSVRRDMKDWDYEMVVVDNHSDDQSYEYLLELTKRIYNLKVIRCEWNSGYSVGNNLGIIASPFAKTFLLLNSDIETLPGFFTPIYDLLYSDDSIGLVAPKLKLFMGGECNPKSDHPIEVDWIGFSTIAIKREVFDKVGILDGKLFHFCSDEELCGRARRAGFKVMFTPHSAVWHHGNASVPELKKRDMDAWVREVVPQEREDIYPNGKLPDRDELYR